MYCTCDNIAPGWIPLDIGRHEVFGGLHDGDLVASRIHELEHAAHTAQPRQHDELTRRAPEQVVRLPLVQGLYKARTTTLGTRQHFCLVAL